MNVNSNKTPPLWRRIQDDLLSRLRAGEWPVGVFLPSRRELASSYEVEVNTLQRAIEPLVAGGILQAQGHKGTIVVRLPEDCPENTPVRTKSTLGIVAMHAADSPENWSIRIVRSMRKAFSQFGGQSIFYNQLDSGQSHVPSLSESANILLERGVDALAFVSAYEISGFAEEAFATLPTTTFPVVLVLWQDVPYPVPHVFYDNRYAGYQAAEHLIQNGWKKICFLAPFRSAWVDHRIEGARLAVRQANLPDDYIKLLQSETDIISPNLSQTVDNMVQTALVDEGVGIITPQDRISYLVVTSARSIGKWPGVHFGLIGFDDEKEALELGISTMSPPLEEMGAEAARLIQCRLRGEITGIQSRLCSHLIPRASSRLSIVRCRWSVDRTDESV